MNKCEGGRGGAGWGGRLMESFALDAMSYVIRNAYTGDTYTVAPNLTVARQFCDQRLLRSAASREGFLSNLAAGYITVYDASATCYRGAGF